MRNALSVVRPAAVPKAGCFGATPRRSTAELLAPLEQLASHSPNFVVNRDARFEVDGESYVLPRYLFIGPKSGDAPIRIGIVAAIHGDELEGAFAAVLFLQFLETIANTPLFRLSRTAKKHGTLADILLKLRFGLKGFIKHKTLTDLNDFNL
jgi:hypothetical protein